MTTADLARTTGQDLSDTEARRTAREMWRAAEAAGEPMTGAELGRAFGKTDRWGRKQIERARSVGPATSVPAGTVGPGSTPDTRNAQRATSGTADGGDCVGEAGVSTALTAVLRDAEPGRS